MRRTALAALSLTLTPLAACSAQAAGHADKEPSSAVPAGVREQYETLAAEVEERGGTAESDGWTVHYIVEAAEPWFEGEGEHAGHYRAVEAGETHHIEIIPVESATGRIVPDVPVTLEVVAADGTVVAEERLSFYHSTFFHYANNFRVPDEGTYTLRARLGDPTFRQHGEKADGPALPHGTTVEFEDVELASS